MTSVNAVLYRKSGWNIRYRHDVEPAQMENFDRLVRFILETRAPLTPHQALDALSGDGPGLSGKSLLVTFDDGLLSSYNATRQVLDPLGIKAIFFVPTGVLELESEKDMRRFASEKLLYGEAAPGDISPVAYQTMSVEQLRELASEGHLICPIHTIMFFCAISATRRRSSGN